MLLALESAETMDMQYSRSEQYRNCGGGRISYTFMAEVAGSSETSIHMIDVIVSQRYC
jgi:hypothetical protein